MTDDRIRCAWGEADELLRGYHDREWGVPERDGRRLWEKLVLDGFQAGLSWRTILARRDGFRRAFDGFDPDVVAAYGPRDIERLLADPGIIRSRAKIVAAIGNARAYVAMREADEDFAAFCWDFVGGRTIVWEGPVPPNSPLSAEASKALKKRGFTFVGPTIVFAWMEATGLIDSHATACFRRTERG
jgi:DNA-3-methyladenine glycosylase I